MTYKTPNDHTMQIRAAQEIDFIHICKLVKSREEMFIFYPRGTYPLTIEQLEHLASTRKSLTVVTHDDQIIGFANLFDFKTGQSASIGNVIVDPAFRGQGVGRKLVRRMLELVFEQLNLPEAHISVFGHNSPALLLYHELGFTPYAIEERHDFADRRTALIHLKLTAKA